MNKKISIFLLGVVILANSVEGARKRQATKKGPKRKNIIRATTPTKSTQPVELPEETYVKIQEPEVVETSSEPTESVEEMQQKIATLTAQNTVLNNEIKEKQTKFNDLTKKLSDIEENFSNLETQQNKSKSTCRNILPKKIDEIKGWLIGAVSASGVGTLAHATATTTSFLQKSEEQFNKKYEKDQLKNQNKFATIDGDNRPSAGGCSAGGCSTKSYNKKNYYKNIIDKDNRPSAGGYAGGCAGGYAGGCAGGCAGGYAGGYAGGCAGGCAGGYAGGCAGGYAGGCAGGCANVVNNWYNIRGTQMTVDEEGKWTIYKRVFVYAFENPNPLLKSDRDEKWAKQQKTNNVLETISNVSTIVGTVASAGTAISSSVATALINTIAQQVKDCKGSF